LSGLADPVSEPNRSIVRFGESALLISPLVGEAVYSLAEALSEIDGVEEALPGAKVLVTVTSPELVESVDALAQAIGLTQASPSRGRVVEVPVVFDGPDLAEVASSTGISERAIGRALAGAPLRVSYLGFTPGFAYVTGLPPALAGLKRRDFPRTSVAAGAVGVAGGYLGIYPRSSPGGWNLIGRTDLPLFNPTVAPYSTLRPGDVLRVVPVDSVSDPRPAPVPPRPRCDSHRRAVVVSPGTLTTLQDGGRRNVAKFGVPRAGPVDRDLMRLANLTAGNDENASALETTLAGPILRFDSDALVVVLGSEAAVDGRVVPSGVVEEIRAGGLLEVSKSHGLHGYVAVTGGFKGPEMFGSCSSDVLTGLGIGALESGDEIGLGDPGHARGFATGLTRTNVIRILRGPDITDVSALVEWISQPFEVTADSNRIGVRLRSSGDGARGPTLDHDTPEGSFGMVDGSMQLPPGDEPIVLLCDHATTGGYPVAATVISADLGSLAQCRPGDHVRFELVDIDDALAARSQRERQISRSASGHYPTVTF
jgi:KipI family sensor histidine kinase inhibitor